MNDKMKTIRLWSLIVLGTTIFNIIFWILSINSGISWLLAVAWALIVWDVVALVFWIMSFTVKYKKLVIDNNEIEIYAGLSNRYIKVNGILKDEYKAISSFTPIALSCLLGDKKLEVIISTSNRIVVKLDGEFVK